MANWELWYFWCFLTFWLFQTIQTVLNHDFTTAHVYPPITVPPPGMDLLPSWIGIFWSLVEFPFNRILYPNLHSWPMMSMDADLNTYPILIPPASKTFHFCHHPQPHHSQPYHAQSIIYHPSFIINGNFRYRAYSITVSIFPIFNRLPSPICPPLNSVKWPSPQNDSCHRR